jgi:LacI family transcriptional regulator
MNRHKHTTIKQVAERAGVSIQTVSRVLNNRPDVSPDTRQRIQGIIEDMKFQPFAVARGLASRRTFTLGFVSDWFAGSFVNQIMTGAELESHKQGYFLMLGSAHSQPGMEPTYPRLVTERHVEGVIFAGAGNQQDEGALLQFKKHGVPVVITGYHKEQALDFSFVDTENGIGGRQATQCLVDQGHTRIAMITGPAMYQSAKERTQGYMEVLSEAGIPVIPELICEAASWEYADGYQAMNKILAQKIPFTALFAQCDPFAISAIAALREAGLRVPGDVSVVGFDNIPATEFTDPPLTTIQQKMMDIGEAAARLLIQQIENPEAKPELILFGTELIVRSSCKCIRS